MSRLRYRLEVMLPPFPQRIIHNIKELKNLDVVHAKLNFPLIIMTGNSQNHIYCGQ